MSPETETASDVSRETQLCSRCDENPVDTIGYPRWCSGCRKKYAKEYRATAKEMSETRGFAAGVAAAKAFLASEFEMKIRGASISGNEAARLVRACNTSGLTA